MTPPSSLRYQGYLAGRTAVLAVLLAMAALFQARRGGFPVPFLWFFALTGAAFAFTAISVIPLRRGSPHPLWMKAQPAWDVAYASGLVFLSGGAMSPFSTLYPLSIAGAAIVLFRRGALLTAGASSVAYGFLVVSQWTGWLAPLNPFPLPPPPGDKVLFQLGFNLLAFYVVSLLSGYLAEELRRTDERLQQARAEVLELEQLKDAILQNLGSGLVALDAAGRVVFHNRWAEELLSRADVPIHVGAPLDGVFPSAGGQTRNEISLSDGAVKLGYSLSPLQDPDGQGRGHILLFQDLTDIKRLEADLRRADRLAAVGRLAAGLAHEVRNPLASLAGSVEMLRGSRDSEAREGPLFDIVLRETERLNRLVTNFLHYARPGRLAPARVPLRELVDEIGFFFSQGEGRERFHLVNNVDPDTALHADRSQLEQILLNLFRNSREAAPGGVAVTIRTETRPGALTLTIEDDGPGMAPDVAERAFEPFFSNREGGTGLGLATIHQIVDNHGGRVELDSRPGEGTCFTFVFPSESASASPEGED